MFPGNAFQTLMKLWTSLGPYNAIDLIQLSGPADKNRWREAVAPVMTSLGFQPPEVIDGPYGNLIGGVATELRKPFAPGAAPVRFFVVEENPESHYFGATFDHWAADSPSYRFVTHRAFEEYQEPGAASRLPPLRVCNKPFELLFGKASWPVAAAETLQAYLRHVPAYRVPIHDPLDLTSGYEHLRLPDGLIGHVRQFGKKTGGTVNDVFLAALLQTMGSFTAAARADARKRLLSPKRNSVAFATAVDIRPMARESLENQFGCYLSYYNVLAKDPEKMPPADLTRQIAAETKRIKSGGLALRFFQSFHTAVLFWHCMRKPQQRALMFNRTAPCAGGISNVNLNDSWISKDARILHYIRVSPTGVLMPIVFTPSTIRDQLSLSVTYRTAVYSADEATAITADFVKRLCDL